MAAPTNEEYRASTDLRVADKHAASDQNARLAQNGTEWLRAIEEGAQDSMLGWIWGKRNKDRAFVPKTTNYGVDPNTDKAAFFAAQENITFTLPNEPNAGFAVFLGLGLPGKTCVVETSGSDYIAAAKGVFLGTTHIETSDYGAYAEFVYVGSNVWFMLDPNGSWQDDTTPTPKKYNYDGNITGGTPGNIVDIDPFGNIRDSGSAPADFEPAIGAKGTAFNKDFGVSAGTVCQGNDVRLIRGLPTYSQAAEPTLPVDYSAIWVDTDDGNRVYLIFNRGSGTPTHVKVELT